MVILVYIFFSGTIDHFLCIKLLTKTVFGFSIMSILWLVTSRLFQH